MASRHPVWLFDLDNTLHDASTASFRELNERMSGYIVEHLGLERAAADALRRHYWQRYGTTLLGLMRHHGVKAAHFLHFLHQTHLLPGLEARVRGHAADFAALARLPGRKYILTNAPAAYTARVLRVLGIARCFDGVMAIEQMHMFGQLRPKPDARMLLGVAARLRVKPQRCVLVEDTLEHQKSARRIGMGTVWMQRWTRAAAGLVPVVRGRTSVTPAYVDRRILRLNSLRRSLWRSHA